MFLCSKSIFKRQKSEFFYRSRNLFLYQTQTKGGTIMHAKKSRIVKDFQLKLHQTVYDIAWMQLC